MSHPTDRADGPRGADGSAARPRGILGVAAVFVGIAVAWGLVAAGVAGRAVRIAPAYAGLAGGTALALAYLRVREDRDAGSRRAFGWALVPAVAAGWGTCAQLAERWGDLGGLRPVVTLGHLVGFAAVALGVLPMAAAAAASRRGRPLVWVSALGTAVALLSVLSGIARSGD